MRDQVQSGELLEDSNRIGCAEDGYGTRKSDVFRSRGSRAQNYGGRRIEELGPMMFADAKNIQPDLVGELDLFQKILHPLNRAEIKSGCRIRDDCPKAVDTDLHVR